MKITESTEKVDKKFEEFKKNLKIKTMEERVKPILITPRIATSIDHSNINNNTSRIGNENINTNDQS